MSSFLSNPQIVIQNVENDLKHTHTHIYIYIYIYIYMCVCVCVIVNLSNQPIYRLAKSFQPIYRLTKIELGKFDGFAKMKF